MKIHFIGIGGIGISALARIYKTQGHTVSGSDMHTSELTEDLKKAGILIYEGHQSENLENDTEYVIYTEAIPDENLEMKKARKLNIPCLTYFQALGEFAKDYKVIAIAGAHGKTTTTAMTALALIEGGLDPTVVVGTKIREFDNRNVRIGKSKYLVVEACEYRESFLNLTPHILVITNVEAEHLDYYKNEENYLKAFEKLVQKVPRDGIIIVTDDENSLKVTESARAQVIKCCIKKDELEITINHSLKYKIPPLQVPGDHYKIDAGLAIAVGLNLGVEEEILQKSLAEFKGTWRRFEFKGEKNGVTVIDDYAHHPTEIKATLKGTRQKFPDKKIICVFQPHQYSRTRELFNDFTKSFSNCNQVLIPNIYRVRDTDEDVKSVSAEKLVAEIQKESSNACYSNGFENTVESLGNILKQGDILITMGAGPVHEVGEMYLGK